jgi:hypothetical protein
MIAVIDKVYIRFCILLSLAEACLPATVIRRRLSTTLILSA